MGKINDQGDLEDDDENLDDVIRQEQKKRLVEKIRMLNSIKSYLLQYYIPSEDPSQSIHFTTSEIQQQLLNLFPTPELTGELVASWLNAAGYKFYDYGKMQFEWLLKKA